MSGGLDVDADAATHSSRGFGISAGARWIGKLVVLARCGGQPPTSLE